MIIENKATDNRELKIEFSNKTYIIQSSLSFQNDLKNSGIELNLMNIVDRAFDNFNELIDDLNINKLSTTKYTKCDSLKSFNKTKVVEQLVYYLTKRCILKKYHNSKKSWSRSELAKFTFEAYAIHIDETNKKKSDIDNFDVLINDCNNIEQLLITLNNSQFELMLNKIIKAKNIYVLRYFLNNINRFLKDKLVKTEIDRVAMVKIEGRIKDIEDDYKNFLLEKKGHSLRIHENNINKLFEKSRVNFPSVSEFSGQGSEILIYQPYIKFASFLVENTYTNEFVDIICDYNYDRKNKKNNMNDYNCITEDYLKFRQYIYKNFKSNNVEENMVIDLAEAYWKFDCYKELSKYIIGYSSEQIRYTMPFLLPIFDIPIPKIRNELLSEYFERKVNYETSEDKYNRLNELIEYSILYYDVLFNILFGYVEDFLDEIEYKLTNKDMSVFSQHQNELYKDLEHYDVDSLEFSSELKEILLYSILENKNIYNTELYIGVNPKLIVKKDNLRIIREIEEMNLLKINSYINCLRLYCKHEEKYELGNDYTFISEEIDNDLIIDKFSFDIILDIYYEYKTRYLNLNMNKEIKIEKTIRMVRNALMKIFDVSQTKKTLNYEKKSVLEKKINGKSSEDKYEISFDYAWSIFNDKKKEIEVTHKLTDCIEVDIDQEMDEKLKDYQLQYKITCQKLNSINRLMPKELISIMSPKET